MKKTKTIFEKIIDREIKADILYEDEKVIIFLDAFPFDKGHSLVVPKKAYETIWDMPRDEFIYLQKILHKFVQKMRKETEKAIVIYQRNLPEAGQEVPHVHFHILPRFTSEKERPVFNDERNNFQVYNSENEKKEFQERLMM